MTRSYRKLGRQQQDFQPRVIALENSSAAWRGFTVVAFALLMMFSLSLSANAAVERVGNWSSPVIGTTMSYSPGVGTDRVILISVTGEESQTAATVDSVTYGGQLVTPIASAVRGAGYSNIAWLGYCNEVCIDNATNTTISVSSSITPNSPNTNNQLVIAAATYQNVEQTNAVYDYDTNNSGSATITGSLNNAEGDMVVYTVAYNGTQSSVTNAGITATNPIILYAGYSSFTAVVGERTSTSAAAPLSFSVTSNAASSRTALVAVSLQEVQCDATAPTDLAAYAPHGGQVELSWTYDSLNNDYYNIYRDGVLIGTSITGAYIDYTVAVSTGYNYSVRGFNNGIGCEAADSNIANVTTGNCAPTTGPLEITGGQTLSGSAVNLTSLVNDNGATVTSYVVSSQLAADFSETESFNGGDTKGWTKWSTDNASDPPGDGDLWTGIHTRTEGTGPGTSPTGSFLFYEATNGTAGDTRYLTHNGSFNANNNEIRVTFNYNLNGDDIKALGALVLEVRQDGGLWNEVWSGDGNLGDAWQTQTVDLEALGYISGTIELRFKFTHGGGYLGDIAIDEIRVYGPGRAGTTYFGPANAASAATAGTTDPLWPDGATLRLDVAGDDNCTEDGNFLSDIGTFTFRQDGDAPVISSFILPAESVSPISVYALNATDTVGVTGYMITETNVAPAANAAGWQATKPTLITTASTGDVTFYAWAKDAAGNVSAAASATVTVSADGTAPIVTAFVMVDSDFSPLAVVSFSATDNSSVVTGYMITESALTPAHDDAGWQAMPPASVASAAGVDKIFYAWAKDSAGNVSTAATYTATVKEDTNAPSVTFVLPATSSSLVFNVATFSATDISGGADNNTGVAGFMITEVDVDADPVDGNDSRWLAAPEFTIVASTSGIRTFKAWAKDNAGNISAPVSQAVDINLPDSCDFDIDPAGTYIEAENYTNISSPTPWEWIEVVNPLNDASGDSSSGGYLSTTVGGTGTAPNGSRTDYPVNFTSSGTYCIWIRALDGSGLRGGDSNFWGIDGAVIGAITQTADNQWAWDSDIAVGSNCTTISAGNHVINLWPRETGQKVDTLFIGMLDANADPSAGGIFTGDNDQTTTTADLDGHSPTPIKAIDPTCIDSSGGGAPGGGGGGSGWIYIPDGQSINGNPIDVTKLFDTDQTLNTCSYRALGEESDGFNGFALDGKWSKTDIGGDPAASPLMVTQKLRLYGGGRDIGSNSDAFTYLYQGGKAGNFTIDVRVESIQNTNSWAKAGIMVRQSLAANSPHASIMLTPTNGVSFVRRTLSGGTTALTTAAGQSAPKWLRLKRNGNSFYGYYSSNGSDWVLVGSATVNMSGTVNTGLAVTSRVTGTDTNALFDNYMFMPGGISGMNETWTATSGGSVAIDTSDWSDGFYGLSVSCSGTSDTETNNFYFSSCIDSTPSTISIHSGQTVSGSAVSLNALYDHTGNVGSFSYHINGIQVLNPWNSYALVPNGNASTATLEVTGTDPDCGGHSVDVSGVINVDNTCIDSDPSTITILTGQTAGGSHVNLTQMVSTTGDVASGGLSYKINGNTIGDPSAWDSRAYGTNGSEAVLFEVHGIDPDCGNSITAINNIEIDNDCDFNPPSIVFDQEINYVGAGRSVPYTITVRNEDSFNCGASTLTVNLDSDSNGGDFDASYFPGDSTITSAGVSVAPDNKSATVTLSGRDSALIELAVTAKSTANEWNVNDTQVSVTSPSGSNNATASTKVFLVSPITHNSVTTNSAKWGGTVDAEGNTLTQGNWGTSDAGSKYGNFDCLTCHEKGGPNIKWMKANIDMPAGSPDATWGTSGLASLPITFQDAREVTNYNSVDNEWGDDDAGGNDLHPADTKGGIGRTGSTRVCEVCHSVTLYHRYDTESHGDGGGAQSVYNHFSGRDCIDCHRHSLGFTASCTGCHGNPPLESSLGGPNGLADIPGTTGSTTPGTHYKHVVVLNYPCEYCHDGWRNVGEMPKVNDKGTPGDDSDDSYDINHKFDVFARVSGDIDYVPATNGNYTGQDGVSYEGVVTPAGQGTLTCENIYCHGGTDSMGGTNPQWNGNVTCNSCHGTSATNTPPGYSHTTHVGKMGQACSVCHGDGTLNPLPGSNGHVNGSVGWDLTGAPSSDGGTAMYKKGGVESVSGETGHFAPSELYDTDGYGTCTNVACHYGTETPIWNSGPATCTTCHNNGTDNGSLTNAAPNTGNHSEHVDPPAGISTTMVNTFINKCESCHGGSSNTGDHPGHIGSSGGSSPVDPSDFVDFGGMTYDAGTQTCTSLCHEASEPGIWGSAAKLSCEACHMAPYLGPTVVDPDNEGNGLYSSNGFGSHLKTVKTEDLTLVTSWNDQCQKCHPYHEGGVTIPEPPIDWDNPGTAVVESDNMAYKLGLQFPVTGGIHLGGGATDVTVGTTEADICWNCHGTDTEVNEWGYNADTNGTTYPISRIAPQTTTPSGHTYWDGDTDQLDDVGGSYNYGYLYENSNWTTATSKWVTSSGWGNYRRDGYQHTTETNPDYLLSRRITSVHSVNFSNDLAVSSVATAIDGSGNVVPAPQETPANIRCSYCHDVHDLNKAFADVNAGITETMTGRPYLRGSWMGNPYPNDVPPLASYTYSTNTGPTQGGSKRGNRYYSSRANSPPFQLATPRLYAADSSYERGGFFIDLNSGQPTNDPDFDSLEETAGICVACHGSDINNMDYYPNTGNFRNDADTATIYSNTTMWRTGATTVAQINGHANATLGAEGATHANARNIFDGRRNTTKYFMAHQNGIGAPRKYGENSWEMNGPFRTDMKKAMDQSPPQQAPTLIGWFGGTAGGTSTSGTEYTIWYAGSTDASNTNAIGTDGSGSGRAHSFTCSKCHSPHATGLPALLITNCLDKNVSNWSGSAVFRNDANPSASQAMNCHRKESTSTGWHRLAPAQ